MSKKETVSKVTFVEYRSDSGEVLAKTTQGKGRQNARAFKEGELTVVPGCSLTEIEGTKAKEVSGITVWVPTTVIAREASFYVVKDTDGNEISREKKGRGKPAKGFEKIGNDWVKVETAPAHA